MTPTPPDTTPQQNNKQQTPKLPLASTTTFSVSAVRVLVFLSSACLVLRLQKMKRIITKSSITCFLPFVILVLQTQNTHASRMFTDSRNIQTRSLADSNPKSTSSTSPPPSSSPARKSDDFAKVKGNCKPAPNSQCEQCPGGARSGHESCEETGKRQEFHCERHVDADDDDSTDGGPIGYLLSCKRTRVEEEYLIMRLQGICALVAFLSLRNVRREKMLSESLFDNRKRVTRQHQPSQQLQQEMAPLTPAIGGSNDLDEENLV